MIVVISGRIKLSLIYPQGKELSLRHLEAGSILGEMAILDDQPRSADATATVATEGYVISKRDFLGLVTERPEAAEAVIRYLCGRCARRPTSSKRSPFMTSIARVARFFLATLRQINGEELPDEANLQLALSQTEIASISGPAGRRSTVDHESRGKRRHPPA